MRAVDTAAVDTAALDTAALDPEAAPGPRPDEKLDALPAPRAGAHAEPDGAPAPAAAPTRVLEPAPAAEVEVQPDAEVEVEAQPDAEPEEPEGPDGPDRGPGRLTRIRARLTLPRWWPAVTLGGATTLWLVALGRIGPHSVGRYGLASGLPATLYAAVGLIALGTIISIRRGAPLATTAAHLVLFVLVIHATPAIAFGELRYAWAWRHVGIVDLMHRRHALIPGTPVLPIYQYWPGFFATATTLTEGAGRSSALMFAAWAPPVFELLFALALWVVLSALTDDRRRVALSVWLFLIANWVGQDYFAPQAFSFFLYLVALAILLRWFRKPTAAAARPTPLPAPQRRTMVWVLIGVMAATTVSHPLTPLILCVALCLLTVFRVLDRRWPAVVVVLLTGTWLVTGAYDYTSSNFSGLVSGLGKLGNNVGSNLANLNELERGAELRRQHGARHRRAGRPARHWRPRPRVPAGTLRASAGAPRDERPARSLRPGPTAGRPCSGSTSSPCPSPRSSPRAGSSRGSTRGCAGARRSASSSPPR